MANGATSLARAGFDVAHGVTAMAIRNEALDRNALDAEQRRAQVGKLYAFGSGDYGRLGHGDNQPKKSAKLVEILRDKNLTKFACGPRHTLALAADGTVYSWGYGGDGQLGHGDFQLQTMPAQIKALQGEHIVDITCGDKHSAVLTSGGDVFTWGDGSLGQLGLGDFRKQHTPHRVMELQGKMILQISCGAYHTACIDKDEKVYTWGQGGSGRLGHDSEHDLAVPVCDSASIRLPLGSLLCCRRLCRCRSDAEVAGSRLSWADGRGEPNGEGDPGNPLLP